MMPRLTRLPALAALVLSALIFAAPARAATLVVINTNDSGAGSLRAQIAASQAGDTITFAPSVGGTITLTTGELDISQDLTIQGPGQSVLAVDGGHTSTVAGSRVFGITGGTVALSGLTIQNGSAPNDPAPYYGSGGGVAINGGTAAVTMTACTISGNSAKYDGGGVYTYSGTVTLTDCTLSGNSTFGGGGIYNEAFGTTTLTGCTLSGNSATTAGGGACNEGTMTLTACTLQGNKATYINGGTGGGASNGGTMTLTACTLQGNSAPRGGGGVFISGGTTTLLACTLSGNSCPKGGAILDDASYPLILTDDILYGDTANPNGKGGVSEIDFYTASQAATTYCDVQGGIGTSDTANHILNADPQFVRLPGTNGSADYGDLHLQSGSPCFRAGVAVSGVTADHDGHPYANPPTLGAYELAPPPPPPASLHLLWDNPDGKAAFWNVDGSGNVTGVAAFGPYADSGSLWHATALATGPDGVSHILWNNPDGHVALWSVTDGGSVTGVTGFGPYSDGGQLWQASGISVGPDSAVHLLWTNPDGHAAFWDVAADGSVPVTAGYGPYSDGGSLWGAVGISTGPDNVSHLLWRNPDGHDAFWNVSDADGTVGNVTGYGPYSDGAASNLWYANAVSTGPDNVSHLLWDNTDFKAAFWNVSSASGAASVLAGYGPYADGSGPWSATALATGPDNVSHLLWNNLDGHVALWALDGSGNPTTVTGYGPYTDGTAQNLWRAVAVSAGP